MIDEGADNRGKRKEGRGKSNKAEGMGKEARRVSRLVVKVGTSTLTNAQGRIDRAFITDLTAQLAFQRAQGRDVLLVSSGAIRAGREALGGPVFGYSGIGYSGVQENSELRTQRSEINTQHPTPNTQHPTPEYPKTRIPDSLPFKQAAAAIGQGLLMHTYTEAFAWREVLCSQVLLTRDDLGDRRRFLNARNTLRALLSLGVVPIINENDTVSVDEIKFGDNDTLAALVATLVEADLLLILSDVEGLYASPPTGNETPAVISTVERIDTRITALAGGALSGVGTGGMRTKVEAARIATEAGIRAVIARGRRERVVTEVLEGQAIGTTFLPCPGESKRSARKRWIAHSPRSRGAVVVNTGAREKLRHNGGSLLAVGITAVNGTFATGDVIEVHDEEGHCFARGLTNYAAAELRRIQGLRSEQFEAVLGYRGFDEVIHRDNLVVDSEG